MSNSKHENTLKTGAINLPELVFTALATLAPLSLVVGVMPLHFLIGGNAVPGGYIAAALVMALFTVGLNTVLKYRRSAGAFYVIIAGGLGKEVGTLAAAIAVLAYNALQLSTYGLIGVFASDAVSRWTGLNIPWWTYGLVALLIVGYLGYRGITTSARVLSVVLILEIAVLLALVIAILMSPSAGSVPWDVLEPANIVSPQTGGMFALIFGAFMGYEVTAIYSEEVKGGARTVRLATYIVVAFIGIFYGFMALMILTGYGKTGFAAAVQNNLETFVLDLFSKFTNPVVYELTNVLLILSAFAALLALHNAANRYVYALGREGILPRLFGRTHSRTQSPWVAGILQSGVAAAVIVVCIAFAFDPYTGLLLVGSAAGFLCIIILWALCALSTSAYLRRDHPEEGVWRTVVAPSLAFIGLVTVTVLVIKNFDLYTGGNAVISTIVFTLTGLSALGGLARALHLRIAAPTKYAQLAMESEEETNVEGPEAERSELASGS